jgi:hypothetical protein
MASRDAIGNTELSLATKSIRQEIERGPVYWANSIETDAILRRTRFGSLYFF